MRTRAVLSSIFTSLGILIVGAQFGSAAASTHVTPSGTSPTGPANPGTTGTGTGTTSPSPSSSPAAPPAATGPKDGTYTGDTYQTPFGNVQVSTKIVGGKITQVTALQLTNADGRSVQISNRAAPILRSEVLKAQSANVNNVSGATYTTDGYLSSLQSAFDKAGFTG